MEFEIFIIHRYTALLVTRTNAMRDDDIDIQKTEFLFRNVGRLGRMTE